MNSNAVNECEALLIKYLGMRKKGGEKRKGKEKAERKEPQRRYLSSHPFGRI